MMTNAQAALQAAATFASANHGVLIQVADVEAIAAEFLRWLELQDRLLRENIKVG